MYTYRVKNNILQHKKKRIKLKPLSKEAVYRSSQEITKILMKGINICSTTSGQQRRGTFARSRYSSIQQRQYRLRSYGVSSAYGDGQMLLPMNSTNSNQVNSNQVNSSQSSSEIPMTTCANLTHRHINSSQQNNTGSESQRRRIPISITTSTLTPISTSIMTTISTSTSTSTSITTSTATNNHQRSHPPGLQN